MHYYSINSKYFVSNFHTEIKKVENKVLKECSKCSLAPKRVSFLIFLLSIDRLASVDDI